MEMRILGYVAASLLLEKEPKQWHALVLLDSGQKSTPFVEAHAPSHLYLHFDDIEQPQVGKQLPTALLIEQGLEFAKGKEKLLVTCRAGQGRSVAMAYLICCQERGVVEAVRLLDPTRHRPNRRVVEIGDALLGNPDILDRFTEWQDRHRHIKLSDYYDQLEKELDALEEQGARDLISRA
jgi:predicted protein tyrosine phosphatase